jgi:hypothetical protein
MRTRTWICILAVTLAGFGMSAAAAEPAPETSLILQNVADADLAALKDNQGLRSLKATRSYVTDAGWAHLKEMKGLQTLELVATQVTDAGLAELKAALPNTQFDK